MKTLIFLAMLFSVLSLPSVGELTQNDLNKIHLIVKEATGPIEANVAVVRTEVKHLNTKIDDKFNSIEKNFDRQSNLIIACIAIPMALIAILVSWRSIRDNAQSKQIEELTRKIEILEQQ